VRLVLPLIPALAASSPVVEGRATGLLDNRLETYRTNSERVRSMTGDVIPEPVYTLAEYRERVFRAIDRELVELGADEILIGQEWTNARGAIVRFDRMAVEIRLIDAQECAPADLAVAAAVTGLVRALVEERWCDHTDQRDLETAPLQALLVDAIRSGPATPVREPAHARAFGFTGRGTPTLGALLQRAVEETFDGPAELRAPLEVVLREGTLSERILRALGPEFDRARLRDVYRRLCDCVGSGASFRP